MLIAVFVCTMGLIIDQLRASKDLNPNTRYALINNIDMFITVLMRPLFTIAFFLGLLFVMLHFCMNGDSGNTSSSVKSLILKIVKYNLSPFIFAVHFVVVLQVIFGCLPLSKMNLLFGSNPYVHFCAYYGVVSTVTLCIIGVINTVLYYSSLNYTRDLTPQKHK